VADTDRFKGCQNFILVRVIIRAIDGIHIALAGRPRLPTTA